MCGKVGAPYLYEMEPEVVRVGIVRVLFLSEVGERKASRKQECV